MFKAYPIKNYTRITRGYSLKTRHKGIDYAANRGVPIYAVDDGVVYKAGKGVLDSSYGYQVVLKHKHGFTNYAHMSRISVKSGNVKAGQIIGYVGSTGNSTGNHLHFEYHKGKLWNRVDPTPYLPSKKYMSGNTYTVISNVRVRTGAGLSYRAKEQKELTPNAKSHAKNGILQKGTRVTAIGVITENQNTWLKIPSGYIAAYVKGKRYVE